MKLLIGIAVLAVAAAAAWAFLFSAESPGSPARLLKAIAGAFPDAIFYRDTTQRVVALTIDDVPWPDDPGDASTQLILDTIAEHNEGIADPALRVRATFFVITGHLADGSTILDRIHQEGHEIANHGTVDRTAALLSPEMFEQELRASHERLVSFTDQPIRWIARAAAFTTRPSSTRSAEWTDTSRGSRWLRCCRSTTSGRLALRASRPGMCGSASSPARSSSFTPGRRSNQGKPRKR